MFVVRCPNCRHSMRYEARKAGGVSEKKKKCVYCNHTFKIHPSMSESRIVREEVRNTTNPLFHSKDQVEELAKKLEE